MNMKEIINNIIASRRSYFPNLFTGEIVDDEIIKQMLINANWAPTHRLTEPWRFCVFKGDGLRSLAEFQSNLYKKVASEDGTFKEAKFQNLLNKPTMSSHVISIGMKRDPEHRIREIEEVEAVACAVQNMYLTATAYDIGCYWGTGGVTYMEEAKSFFGLNSEDKLLGFLFVGVPRKKVEGKRNPIDQKTKWILE